MTKRGNFIQRERLARTSRVGIVLNNKEREALESYCKKYKIDNKSKFIRETIFKHIVERFLTDYPTLFEQDVLNSLVFMPQQKTFILDNQCKS